MALNSDASSPHKTAPKVMIESLMRETAKRLNMFPAKHRTSSMHSPSAPPREPKLQCNKHSQHSSGECVQASLSNQMTNATVERTIDEASGGTGRSFQLAQGTLNCLGHHETVPTCKNLNVNAECLTCSNTATGGHGCGSGMTFTDYVSGALTDITGGQERSCLG